MFIHNQCIHQQVSLLLLFTSMSGQTLNTIWFTLYYSFRPVYACVRGRMCVCERVCVRACVSACVRACVGT